MAAVSEAYAAEAAWPTVQQKTLTLHTVHPTQFMDLTRLIEARLDTAVIPAICLRRAGSLEKS